MPRTTRRAGVLAIAVTSALTASTLALPLVTAQAVVTTTEKTVYLADTNGDGGFGLYSGAPGGPATTLVAESATTDITEVHVSQDHSRLITIEDSFPATGTGYERVVVRDAGTGRLVRVLEQIPSTSDDFAFGATLSPGGSSAVWTRVSFTATSSTVSLRHSPVAAGAASALPGGADLVYPAFLDDTTLIASKATSGEAVTLPAAGGATSGILGSPVQASDFTVSPDRGTLAWSSDTTPPGSTTPPPSTSTLRDASFSVSGGKLTLGTIHDLSTTQNNVSPAFSADSATLRFVHNDGGAGLGDIWSAPADGSGTAAVTTATPTIDELAVAVVTVDTTAPAPVPTINPAVLNGSSATVSYVLPTTDPDLSGVLVERQGTPARTFYVPAPIASFVDTGLTVGSTYTYVIKAVDRSGNASGPTSRRLTALRVAPSFASPTSGTTTRAPFPVVFGRGDPASALFTVDYSTNSGAFAHWVIAKPGASRTFGAPSTGAFTTSSVVGRTYRFKVQATDAFGNKTAVVTTAGATVPTDQTRAIYSTGAVTSASTDRWLGTATRLKPVAGATARVSLPGYRVQVIGERCPTCGIVDVYSGSTRIGSYDSVASRRLARQVLFTYTFTTKATRTITLRNRGTSRRSDVILDGFATWN